MKVEASLSNSANGSITATVSKEYIDNLIEKLAKEAAKTMKVDGFRKGKIPKHVVISRYGDQLTQDAHQQVIQEVFTNGVKEAGENIEVLGQPRFDQFDEKDGGLEIALSFAVRPEMSLEDYESCVPDFTKPEISDEDVEAEIKKAAESTAPSEKIKRKRMLREGDIAIIDFVGTLEGEEFEGGKAEDFELNIGANQFIEGFEEGLIGMKYDEERTLDLNFPADYHADHLAGKPVQFKVTLKQINEKVAPELNDELAKKLMPNDENATLESLKELVKNSMQSEKLSKLYNDELKPQLLEALVEKYNFDLPQTIVDEEIGQLVNNKLHEMKEEERNEYLQNREKIDGLKGDVENEAKDRVKTTLIIDEVAKREEVSINDQEVAQTIYYEAMQYGQDPKQAMEYYQKNGLLPIIKMSMLEDRVLSKLLDRKTGEASAEAK